MKEKYPLYETIDFTIKRSQSEWIIRQSQKRLLNKSNIIREAIELLKEKYDEKIEQWECKKCGLPCKIEIHYDDSSLEDISIDENPPDDRFRAKVCLCDDDKSSSSHPEWKKSVVSGCVQVG